MATKPETGTSGEGAFSSSAVEGDEVSPALCAETVIHTSKHRKTGF